MKETKKAVRKEPILETLTGTTKEIKQDTNRTIIETERQQSDIQRDKKENSRQRSRRRSKLTSRQPVKPRWRKKSRHPRRQPIRQTVDKGDNECNKGDNK